MSNDAGRLLAGSRWELDAYRLYDRACSLPHAQVVVLPGEGTFHQVHGGVATNALVSPMGGLPEGVPSHPGEAISPSATRRPVPGMRATGARVEAGSLGGKTWTRVIASWTIVGLLTGTAPPER